MHYLSWPLIEIMSEFQPNIVVVSQFLVVKSKIGFPRSCTYYKWMQNRLKQDDVKYSEKLD